MSSTVKVSYLGDADSLARASRKAQGDLDRVGSKARKVGGMIGKAMGGVAVAGVAAFGAVLKTGFDEVKDYQTGLADLNNVIKTTKGAAGVTAAQMEKLASSIEAYSGQTDDSIVKAQGLLATFTNIRNVAGKNNDIFTQATKISADMAQKFGGDASDSAIKLGKALNDPTKGLTALSKIGVSFTEQQKKQIVTMQKAGDIVGAQKIILAELTKEVGGSAQAYGGTLAGQIDRAKRSFEGASQQLVTAMLPAITRVMTFVTVTALPAMQKFVTQMQNGEGAGGKFAAALKRIWEAAQLVWQHLAPIVNFFVAHPDVFKAVALSAAALGAALKIQAVYGAIVAKFMPGLAVSTAAQGRAAQVAAASNAANATAMSRALPLAMGLMAVVPNIRFPDEKLTPAQKKILEDARSGKITVEEANERARDNISTKGAAKPVKPGQTPSKGRPMTGGGVPKYARGGVLPDDWALVGEGGPELARMPGARVFSNRESKEMLRGPIDLSQKTVDALAAAIVRGFQQGIAGVQRNSAAKVAY